MKPEQSCPGIAPPAPDSYGAVTCSASTAAISRSALAVLVMETAEKCQHSVLEATPNPPGVKVHFSVLVWMPSLVPFDIWTNSQGLSSGAPLGSLAWATWAQGGWVYYPHRDCLSRGEGTAGEEKLPLCLDTQRMNYLGLVFYISWEPSVSVCMVSVWQIKGFALATFQKSHLP